jgi:TonB-linked SusC/RagA family outer membrane protein
MKFVRYLLPVLVMALIGPVSLSAQEQTGTVTGRVVDATTRGPLVGANIVLEGTQRGTLTRADGGFLLTGVPVGTQTLRASQIGYAAQSVEVQVGAGATATAQFELEPQAVLLDELVAIGYGTQRRANLTGAVSTVSAEQLTERPVARVTEALQGSTPGLTVIQRSAQPGRQSIDFDIRGRGSLGGTTPLVLIDGVPGDINQVNPRDIENIAVLKDAGSAAIYGARAANGVILVTTRRGSAIGGLRMSYDAYYGRQDVATFPETVGPRDYMGLINEAATNRGLPAVYSEEFISGVERTYRGDSNADPINYPWNNWLDVLFNPAPIQDHTLTVAGGSELARFNLSLNYFDHQGMLPQTSADRIAVRLNTDFDVTERLQAGVDVNLRQTSDMEPHDIGGVTFRMFHDTPPWVMAKYPDGTYGWSKNNHNPLAYAEESGRRDREVTHGTLSAKADYQLLDGLTVRTLGSAQTGSWRLKDWRNQVQWRDYHDPSRVVRQISTNRLYQEKDNYLETYLRAMGEFDRTLADRHRVTAILGYDQTAADWDRVGGFREVFYSNDLREINAGDASRDGNTGTSYQWRLRSGFGRLAYGYDDRYLLEFNARYDGSSRFAEGNRFGWFPAVSAAWRISQEAFFPQSLDFISELKLRGSWGKTGNQNIQRGNNQLYYPSYSTIVFGHNYIYGDQLTPGAAQTEFANRDISWEATEMSNVGLDLELLNGRFSFIGDVYRKTTDGILLALPIPNLIGLAAPVQNAAVIRNSGWEAAVNWRDRAGPVNYSLGFNIYDNRNEVVSLQGTGPYIDGRWITQEGISLGTMWGYEALGLFVNQAEVDAHAQQDPATGPGDIKFRDVNGDGVINAQDRVAIGNDLPRYTLGSNLGASYRGFDLGLFFQGVMKVDAYIEGAMTEGPVWENFTTHHWLDRWTHDNPNPNASRPKPSLNQHHNHGPVSSFWVQDASYLKLKTAQLGYTLPATTIQRIGYGLNGMRIYVSGQNLITWTGADILFDPEFPSGRGTVYPQTRTISIGTSIQF